MSKKRREELPEGADMELQRALSVPREAMPEAYLLSACLCRVFRPLGRIAVDRVKARG